MQITIKTHNLFLRSSELQFLIISMINNIVHVLESPFFGSFKLFDVFSFRALKFRNIKFRNSGVSNFKVFQSKTRYESTRD